MFFEPRNSFHHWMSGWGGENRTPIARTRISGISRYTTPQFCETICESFFDFPEFYLLDLGKKNSAWHFQTYLSKITPRRDSATSRRTVLITPNCQIADGYSIPSLGFAYIEAGYYSAGASSVSASSSTSSFRAASVASSLRRLTSPVIASTATKNVPTVPKMYKGRKGGERG